MMTVKSDDVVGRVKVYESIVKGQEISDAGVPESFRVLMKEFQALGLDVSIQDDEGKYLGLKDIEESEDKEDLRLSMDEVEGNVNNDSPPPVENSEYDEDYPLEDEMDEEDSLDDLEFDGTLETTLEGEDF